MRRTRWRRWRSRKGKRTQWTLKQCDQITRMCLINAYGGSLADAIFAPSPLFERLTLKTCPQPNQSR